MQYEQTFNANPHKVEEVDERTPQEVYDNLRSLIMIKQTHFWMPFINNLKKTDIEDYLLFLPFIMLMIISSLYHLSTVK